MYKHTGTFNLYKADENGILCVNGADWYSDTTCGFLPDNCFTVLENGFRFSGFNLEEYQNSTYHWIAIK